MKYQVVYGSFVKHRVSCNSRTKVLYCKQQLGIRDIACEVIEVEHLSNREKENLVKSDFSFERFKKEILK